MKRIIALLLCLIMTVGLLGCIGNQGEEASTPSLKVGFGRADITPEFSVRLGGYGGSETRWSQNVLDPLYATCTAFQDAEGNTVVLMQLDMCTTAASSTSFARKKISKALGIPVDQVMVHATHSHSTPRIQGDEPAINKYNDFLQDQMVAAAEAAIADLKPARMYTTKTTVNGVNFVRHYRMDDGSIVGDNFGTSSGKTFVKHMKDADNEMQLIRFVREGGKDVVMVNWQVHPIRTGGSTKSDISSDVVGAMRMVLEPMMDCYMHYCTGGAGDLDPYSQIAYENITADYLEQGNLMAQAAIWAMDNMKEQETGKVQILRRDQAVEATGGNGELLCYAFSVGDVAFVTASYEMFDTNAKYIKDNTPFEMTFVASLANGVAGYVAAEWAYYDEIVSYEVSIGNYVKGTGEKLAEGFVDMLNELYPTRK